MNRYLEIDQTGTVVNVIIWDGVSPYNPPGLTLLPCDEHPEASFGWVKTETGWIAPEPVIVDIDTGSQ